MKLEIVIDGRSQTLEITDELRDGSAGGFVYGEARASADVREVEPGVYSVLIAGRNYEVKIEPGPAAVVGQARSGAGESASDCFASVRGRRYAIHVNDPRRLAHRKASIESVGRQRVTSPMPGKIVRVLVREGDTVTAGQGIVVVEAMKMQNEIRSPKDGLVVALHVDEGSAVAGGDTLAEVE
jgi:biotin carboxyl carrier protein